MAIAEALAERALTGPFAGEARARLASAGVLASLARGDAARRRAYADYVGAAGGAGGAPHLQTAPVAAPRGLLIGH